MAQLAPASHEGAPYQDEAELVDDETRQGQHDGHAPREPCVPGTREHPCHSHGSARTFPKAAPSSWNGRSSAIVAQPAGPRHRRGATLAIAAARQTVIQPTSTAAFGR